jgi:hypothetical protein
MKLRAFVVMPFGTGKVLTPAEPDPKPVEVDFDSVYSELLAPALVEADCEPFRADSQASAGDIRTDMFFELVTADVVVADLSILNPNVYYELGIRDGVCPRGVFIIDGGWSAPKPFDIAQDRSFKYDGKLFSLDAERASPIKNHPKEIKEAIKALGAVLTRALQSDGQGTGSPLYGHLPGLRPVNWDGIEISKARYFGTLQRDWEQRVRTAREMDRPGHIITLAQDAPTRLHRTKILWEAARALIGLCEFHAAEDVLQEILRITPDDIDSQLYLGIVLAICRDTERAEHQLRSMLHRHETDPKAGAALGYVYRLLWYLQWKDAQNPRERARESIQLLVSSIRSFLEVHRLHPEEYFSGYNALLLLEVATELFPDLRLPERFVNRGELATVVRYTANAARENAEKTGDYDTQFWSAVALSGLEMLANNDQEAAQRIEDACAVPSATRFFLRLLKERLDLLRLLKFREKFVIDALKIVDRALRSKQQQKRWARVFVFHGYPIDEKDQVGRFPASAAKAVENRIRSVLEEWKVGAGDLAICSGSTESDVMFGERCLELNAKVRLLMLEPTPLQLVKPFLDPACNEWVSRCSALLDHPETEVWYHTDELGNPVEPATAQSRHNRWILNTARMEAENADEETRSPEETCPPEETRLYGLVLWDGSLSSVKVTDAEDPSFFISEIRAANRYRGHVLTINPSDL